MSNGNGAGYVLDPLQTVIRMKPPGLKIIWTKLSGNGVVPCNPYFGGTNPETCYCPGIFCIGGGGCCGIGNPPCTFLGMEIDKEPSPGACASGQWVYSMWSICPPPCDDVNFKFSMAVPHVVGRFYFAGAMPNFG